MNTPHQRARCSASKSCLHPSGSLRCRQCFFEASSTYKRPGQSDARSIMDHTALVVSILTRPKMGITRERWRRAGYHQGNEPRTVANGREQSRTFAGPPIYPLHRASGRALRQGRPPAHPARYPEILCSFKARLPQGRDRDRRKIPRRALLRGPPHHLHQRGANSREWSRPDANGRERSHYGK